MTQPLSRVARGHALLACVVTVAVIGLSLAQEARSLERIYVAPTGIGRGSDQMGHSVALLADTAAVGAPLSQVVDGVNSGTVDIYRLQNGAWQAEAVMSPPDPVVNQEFGNTVALGPDLLVVGDYDSLYTFERSGSVWQQVDEMSARGTDQIGLSGDTLAAAGTVYLRSASGWQEQAELVPDEIDGGVTASAIEGDLLANATEAFSLNAPPRAVYFYSRSGTTWTREGRVQLVASYEPVHVAISGNTALIGAHDSLTTSSVRVFDRDDAGNWVDHGTLDAGVDLTGEVPVSIDGDLALVGSPDDFTAYTFVRSGGTWSRDLHFNDPSSRCFRAVSLWESTALAGCPFSYSLAGGYGTADFFSLDSNPPIVVAQFGQGDSHAGELFGWRAAADGNTLIANSMSGTRFYDQTSTGWTQTNAFPNPPTNFNAASTTIDGDTAAIGYPIQIYPGGTSEVDVYVRAGGTWTLQSAIPGPPTSDASPYFASALALQDNTLVVGEIDLSSSVCHVFQRSGAVWQAGPDLLPAGGVPGDYFCWSAAMSGDTLLVGAPRSDIGIETDAGAVYVFVRSGSTWTQQAQLLAPLVVTRAGFGISVAIRGDTAVVGSNNDTSPSSSTRGEVNVYRRSGTTWNWQAMLEPAVTGNAPGDFGFAVAVSEAQDRILATAPYDLAHDPYAGVAFAFAFDGSQWSQSATIYASPPSPTTTNDLFGMNASFSGEQYVVGAPQDGIGGAVYVGPTSEAIFANGFEAPPP
jgi:hypothetical protein